jgi:hypothetical protein
MEKSEMKSTIVSQMIGYPEIEKSHAKKTHLNSTIKNKQRDLLYFKSILVSSNWNANDDIFLKDELLKSWDTPVSKPVDLEHEEEKIIGHMYESEVCDKEGNVLSLEQAEKEDEIDIVAFSVLYKWKFPKEAGLIKESLDPLSESYGQYAVSMEAWFTDYDYQVGDLIIKRDKKTSYLDGFLRCFGGLGFHKGQKIGRVLRDITFGGIGIVKHPANKDSVILAVAKMAPKEEISNGEPIVLLNANQVQSGAPEKVEDKTEGGEGKSIKAEIVNSKEEVKMAETKTPVAAVSQEAEADKRVMVDQNTTVVVDVREPVGPNDPKVVTTEKTIRTDEVVQDIQKVTDEATKVETITVTTTEDYNRKTDTQTVITSPPQEAPQVVSTEAPAVIAEKSVEVPVESAKVEVAKVEVAPVVEPTKVEAAPAVEVAKKEEAPAVEELEDDLLDVFASETKAAKWTRKFINSLPDAAFAVIEPAYSQGKTEDKNCRHLPHHNADVKSSTENTSIDMPHLRNALARMNQVTPVTDSISADELRSKATAHLNRHRAAVLGGVDVEAIGALEVKITELETKLDTATKARETAESMLKQVELDQVEAKRMAEIKGLFNLSEEREKTIKAKIRVQTEDEFKSYVKELVEISAAKKGSDSQPAEVVPVVEAKVDAKILEQAKAQVEVVPVVPTPPEKNLRERYQEAFGTNASWIGK